MATLAGVITGDIIDFTKVETKYRKVIPTLLGNFFDTFQVNDSNDLKIKVISEIYRGDSFQCFLESPEYTLRFALLIRTFLQSRVYPTHSIRLPLDARIGMGIGNISYIHKTLAESDGEAFHFSGRLLDSMNKNTHRIALQSRWAAVNTEMDVTLTLLDALTQKWTEAQAEVIHYKLLNYSEAGIAKKLNVTQPTINKHSTRASWHAVEKAIFRFEEIIGKK